MAQIEHVFRQERKKSKAQSLIELSMVLVVLLFLLTGLVEIAVLLNQYISVQDAARMAAREGSSADPIANIRKFFSNKDEDPGVPVYVRDALDPIILDPTCGNPGDPCDDIVLSVYSVEKGKTPKMLFVDKNDPGENPSCVDGVYSPCSVYGNHTTRFTSAKIGARLKAGAPNTGLVVIEIFYSYKPLLNLFWTKPLGNEKGLIPLHIFVIMPLSAAEPTPTPD